MKYLLISLLFVTFLNAKKDFYFSYIKDNKEQLSQSKKNEIKNTNSQIIYINNLLKNGKIHDAYKQILLLKSKNKIKILNSSIELLYSDILYHRKAKKFTVEASSHLEEMINSAAVNQSDLLDAFKLMTLINIKLNKLKDARFYIKSILNIYKDPLAIAHAKILAAKIDIKKRNYKRAIKILYKILIKTKNIEVATIVADELFDAYILNKQNDKAKTLASKVLDKNMKYYSTNSYQALIKINKLTKVKMPHLAIKILKELLNISKKQSDINNFKFKLANTYMSIYTKKHIYLLKAKELYKDLVRQKRKHKYQGRAKMLLDEILMRQKLITPETLVKKYPDSAIMYNRSLFQELLNHKEKKEYEKINKLKNVYLKITDTTPKRFGYESVGEIFDITYAIRIQDYLKESKCKLLDDAMSSMPKSTLKKLIENEKNYPKLFECMLEYPNKKSFIIANDIFKTSKDAKIFFILEKIAIHLNLNKEAYKLSLVLDKLDNEKIKSEEFLYRFIIYSNQNNSFSMNKFFTYALKNKQYIKNNQNNPKIIDFYYQYYLYLIKGKKYKNAAQTLKKLFDKQNAMDAHVYSPFVEMQLSSNEKLDDNYKASIEFLDIALENSRKIKDNDLVQIYFDMAKSYKKLNKINRYKDAIVKCKNVQNATSLYKSMCDKL